jgi:hypothetical protein
MIRLAAMPLAELLEFYRNVLLHRFGRGRSRDWNLRKFGGSRAIRAALALRLRARCPSILEYSRDAPELEGSRCCLPAGHRRWHVPKPAARELEELEAHLERVEDLGARVEAWMGRIKLSADRADTTKEPRA